MSTAPALFKSAVKASIRRIGYDIHRVTSDPRGAPAPIPVRPYTENPEHGPINLRCKLDRQARGGPFEWPDIVALNRAVANLIGPAKRIVELGGGTGCFAWHAAIDPTRHVTCADRDADAIAWAIEHRARPNIRYVTGDVSQDNGPFDLLASIEVVEHVADYAGFLKTSAALASRALMTTPNRRRSPATDHAGPPPYGQHVREWTAGEFYWVLRCFYEHVTLYAMPDVYAPEVTPIDVTSTRTPLIADCRGPRRELTA